MEFFGRENELAELSQLWNKRVSSLVTCRGRRRIGKSSLIERFAAQSRCRFIEIVGLAPQPKMTNQNQLDGFCEQLAQQSVIPKGTRADSWMTAFRLLDGVLDDSRTIVLLDEVSWMGRYDPDFAGFLKTAWDLHLKKHNRLVLVVCGSVSTWIQRNILESSAFAGRLSLNLIVDELPLRDCVRFWGARASRLEIDEFVNVLSVTGGVPRYLENIDPTVSADENIRRMCFVPTGSLVDEFDQIFSEIFEESAGVKKQILHAIAKGPLPATEIAETMKIDRNGHLSRNLDELAMAGFIAKECGLNPATGKAQKIATYRIRDNYTRFYLHHVEPRLTAIKAGAFRFASLASLSGWKTIVGLQFENLIVSHYRELLPYLHIGQSLILSAAPFRKTGPKGVQVDLLIQLENAFYVIEVKHQAQIGRAVETEMLERISRLPHKGHKSIRTVLVYDGELDQAIEDGGFFDVLISSKQLLECTSSSRGTRMP